MKRFDWEKLNENPFFMVINGKRCSGKTELMKKLSQELDHQIISTNCDGLEFEYNKLMEQFNKESKKKVLIMMDDCFYDANFFKKDYVKKLFTTYRHYNISICISMQHSKVIPPVIRPNITHICLFRYCDVTTYSDYKYICNTYFKGVDLVKIIEPYECIVIDLFEKLEKECLTLLTKQEIGWRKLERVKK